MADQAPIAVPHMRELCRNGSTLWCHLPAKSGRASINRLVFYPHEGILRANIESFVRSREPYWSSTGDRLILRPVRMQEPARHGAE